MDILSLQCVELVDSYATLLFAKIAEIKPEEFCKRNGLCRDNALLSGVRSESTCVFCHHLMDEVLSKLKDPDAEVIPLFHLHHLCLHLYLVSSFNNFHVISVVRDNSNSPQGVQEDRRS